MELPGLERLLEVCERLRLQQRSSSPAHVPWKAGTQVEGHPFDPMLAAFYARFGFAAFASDVAGIVLHPLEEHDRQLEEQNRWWSEGYRKQLALPTFVFAGEPHLAYHYATVPGLADEEGCQPVVMVDVYEEPYAVPVASNVDRFFETYSRYLEVLMALPNAREEGGSLLAFPWEIPQIIGRDARLVELLLAGRFSSIMKTTGDTPKWLTQVLAVAGRS